MTNKGIYYRRCLQRVTSHYAPVQTFSLQLLVNCQQELAVIQGQNAYKVFCPFEAELVRIHQ